MRFFETLAVFALAGSAAATPATVMRNGVQVRAEKKECLCQADAELVVDHYKKILNLWKPEYAAWLADDGFYDHSESINFIAGVPYGLNIFPNKTAFVGYETYTPDLIPLVIDRIGPYNCNEVAFIWSAKFTKVPGATPLPVRGITILGAVKKAGNWLIKTIDVEFSPQYIINLGGTATKPTPPPS